MKTYLVTGGAGFIGANFILYMLGKYRELKIINLDSLTYAGNLENLKSVENDERHQFIKGDICDRKTVFEIFEKYSVTQVVNFAAESHVDRSILDPQSFAETNIRGTIQLLDAAKAAWQAKGGGYIDGCRFLQVSTDEVYGSLGETGYFTEDTPLDPRSPYSASKASADMFVKAYFETFGLPVNITRCSNNYGPFQFPEKLIPLMINNALLKKPLPVYGDGLQVRDWLYVKDHCKAIDMVMEKAPAGEIYNVGGHNERTNLKIVQTIIEYIGEHVDKSVDLSFVKHMEDRKGHDRRYGIDPEKIKQTIGWQPETKYEDGIKQTIRWYLDNRGWLENVTGGGYRVYYDKMYERKNENG